MSTGLGFAKKSVSDLFGFDAPQFWTGVHFGTSVFPNRFVSTRPLKADVGLLSIVSATLSSILAALNLPSSVGVRSSPVP